MTQTSVIEINDTILLIIDIQESFRKAIHRFDNVIAKTNLMIKAATILGIPSIVTEQYPKGLGKTVKEISKNLKDQDVIEKITFSCFGNQSFRNKLTASKRKTLLICGIESHVCIIQTALDALHNGFYVHLISDAISSRSPENKEIGLRAARDAGASLSCAEMAIFQVLRKAGTDDFKKIAPLFKQ